MNGLIQELVQELTTNESLKGNVATTMVAESINNQILLGVSPSQVFESALTNLEKLSEATSNDSLMEVVKKFQGLAKTPSKKLKDMSAEANLSTKIKSLKESALAKDPVFRHKLAVLESGLQTQPEFRMIGHFMTGLSNYSYDSQVAEALSSVSAYLEANRSRLEVMNAVHEMRAASPVIYKEACAILEEALLENVLSADSLKMKLRGRVNMPYVTRLINTLSMVEAREAGNFNIGIGNGDTKVSDVILPFFPISENHVATVMDDSYVKLSDEDAPEQMSKEEVDENYPEFAELHESLRALGFKSEAGKYTAKLKNMTVGFEMHEGALQFTINGNVMKDPTSASVSETFLMESVETRKHLSTIFKNLDNFANLDFAKRLINERIGSDAYVFTIGESIFVFEKLGQTRVIKKMEGTQFYNYVMENFNYDVAELYSVDLEEEAKAEKEIEAEKENIENNISKLEGSIAQIDETLKAGGIEEKFVEQLNELKHSIEKNVNALKDKYIELDHNKSKKAKKKKA